MVSTRDRVPFQLTEEHDYLRVHVARNGPQTFDVVVIDEAAQALEASCWGAIMRGGKVVLAGDHLQLPPTVLSDVAAREGLSETLFQRAHGKWYRENVAVMLTTQYRMHEDIMRRVL